MSKAVKQYMTDELSKTFDDVKDFLLVDYLGFTAEEAGQLRNALRAQEMSMKVVKNSLLVKALHSVGLYEKGSTVTGPTAVIWGGESAVDISRTVEAWGKKAKELPVKGGMLDGVAGGPDEAAAWAKLPSKRELLAQVLGTLIAPATSVASLMQSSLTLFPRLVNAHVAKLEEGQGE